MNTVELNWTEFNLDSNDLIYAIPVKIVDQCAFPPFPLQNKISLSSLHLCINNAV